LLPVFCNLAGVYYTIDGPQAGSVRSLFCGRLRSLYHNGESYGLALGEIKHRPVRQSVKTVIGAVTGMQM
jgi:hypothetical protein